MKNWIMAVVLGLFLFGNVPAEASAMTDLVLSTGNAEVQAVEVMHRPPHHGGHFMPPRNHHYEGRMMPPPHRHGGRGMPPSHHHHYGRHW